LLKPLNFILIYDKILQWDAENAEIGRKPDWLFIEMKKGAFEK